MKGGKTTPILSGIAKRGDYPITRKTSILFFTMKRKHTINAPKQLKQSDSPSTLNAVNGISLRSKQSTMTLI
ncbi:hypothetical protein EIN43_22115 [Enterobacter hormaechei]|uniref:Uncharacterized protein n=1 Tax=Enterobacter hormaechei TaxID=158836 RepID=A0A4Y5ZPH5_9ENTR|nr:hypothetical protein EIN43_22115 [Enterobacter hormaechei]